MYKQNKILGLIVARGGSKSIPKKSIFPCAGKPLLFYTIKAAQASKYIDRLIISTDDLEIAAVAKEYGVEVPFIRPKELAEDLTPDLAVFEHALETLLEKENYRADIVVHLRPTTPLKKTSDIDKGIELLADNPEAESVRSVCEPAHTPFKMYKLEQGDPFLKPLLKNVFPETFEKYPEAYNMPRQILPKVYRHSGYVDVIRYDTVTQKKSMSGRRILPLEFTQWRDIDIDSMKELNFAETVVRSIEKEGKNPWD